jgi:hypothetical protein
MSIVYGHLSMKWHKLGAFYLICKLFRYRYYTPSRSHCWCMWYFFYSLGLLFYSCKVCFQMMLVELNLWYSAQYSILYLKKLFTHFHTTMWSFLKISKKNALLPLKNGVLHWQINVWTHRKMNPTSLQITVTSFIS